MNVASKIILSYPRYNKNFKPCNLDICSCIITYNLQSSYTDRYLYKKCYEKVEVILSTPPLKGSGTAGHSFDG